MSTSKYVAQIRRRAFAAANALYDNTASRVPSTLRLRTTPSNHTIDEELTNRGCHEKSFDAGSIPFVLSSGATNERSNTIGVCDYFANGRSRFVSEFSMSRWLGSGGFGRVCAAFNKLDLHEYAVKLVPLVVDASRRAHTVLREVRTMARLPIHLNIVRYFSGWIELLTEELSTKLSSLPQRQNFSSNESFSSSTSLSENDAQHHNSSSAMLFIQMECCSCDTLRHWLHKRNGVNPSEIVHIFKQMLEAVEHLHKHDVVHRDLKPENIFLDERKIPKVGDFGLSAPLKSNLPFKTVSKHPLSRSHTLGTISYAAPEQLANDTQSNKVDIFAMGVCLFELFCSFSTQMERAKCFQQTRQGCLDESFISRWPKVASLVSWMTNSSAFVRPSAHELLQQPLFATNNPEPKLVDDLQRMLRHRNHTIRRLQHKLRQKQRNKMTN